MDFASCQNENKPDRMVKIAGLQPKQGQLKPQLGMKLFKERLEYEESMLCRSILIKRDLGSITHFHWIWGMNRVIMSATQNVMVDYLGAWTLTEYIDEARADTERW